MIRILKPNKDGKFEFTETELNELLREARQEGIEEERLRKLDTTPHISNRHLNESEESPLEDALKFWYKDKSEEERRRMFYVDHDELPYYKEDIYEKAPYWMRPGFKMPEITCKPYWKDNHYSTTACPSPDLWSTITSIDTTDNKGTGITTASNIIYPRKRGTKNEH